MTDAGMVNYPIDLGTFDLYRGDASGRNTVTITLTDADDAPVDLTVFGTTWKSQAKYGLTTIDLEVDDSGAASGVLALSIPDEASATLPTSLRFDAQVSGGTIDPLTVFAGKFFASGEVTT